MQTFRSTYKSASEPTDLAQCLLNDLSKPPLTATKC